MFLIAIFAIVATAVVLNFVTLLLHSTKVSKMILSGVKINLIFRDKKKTSFFTVQIFEYLMDL